MAHAVLDAANCWPWRSVLAWMPRVVSPAVHCRPPVNHGGVQLVVPQGVHYQTSSEILDALEEVGRCPANAGNATCRVDNLSDTNRRYKSSVVQVGSSNEAAA